MVPSMRKRVVALASVVATVALVFTGSAYVASAETTTDTVTAADGPYKVYMSTKGSDKNDGSTLAKAVASLEGAEQALVKAKPTTDVEVLIDKGTYVAGTTKWQFTVPGHSIAFKRLKSDSRPVFSGNNKNGYWFSASTPAGEDGGNANLHFYGLKVQDYSSGGLQFRGKTKTVNGMVRADGVGLNKNTVENMWFSNIGSKHTGGNPGYGAINLWNSSNNTFRNITFTNIENAAPNGGMMHGVYAAHHSNGNKVFDSRFEYISGDPVRVRNDSNNNSFYDNSFKRTGVRAQYSDWFCHQWCADQNDQARECASHGNKFYNNDNISGYDGSVVGNWAYVYGDRYTTGGSGCDNKGQDRVKTWGNT